MKRRFAKLKGRTVFGIIGVASILIAAAVVLLITAPTAYADSPADYTYTVNPDGITATITGYTGAGGDITIPDTLDGYSVTAIGESAFENTIDHDNKITSVIMPDTILTIGDRAFFRCRELKNIIFSCNITEIGDCAFLECFIKEINLPNTVNAIGDYAFAYGNNIVGDIYIPQNISSIGYRAFEDCPNITGFTVNTLNLYYSSENGILFNKDKTELIVCPSSNLLTNYTIPESVSIIDDMAFDGSRIERITIPSGVIDIGYNAFHWCWELIAINVVEENLYYSSDDGILFNKDKTRIIKYPQKHTGDSYTIPGEVNEIEDYAFNCCHNLTSIYFPDSITTISAFAFDCCSRLSNINIPDSVTTLNPYAFQYCYSLKSIKIPASVAYIHPSAFEGCKELIEVVFYGNAPSLGYKAFFGCNDNLILYHTNSAIGFTNPWNGYNTAEFDPNITCTISFNLNGDIGSPPESQIQYCGLHVIEPNQPSRQKFDFDGWYSDASLTNRWDFSINTVSTDITLYAKWTCTVNASSNTLFGYTIGGGIFDEGAIVTLNAITSAGCKFMGWYENGALVCASETYVFNADGNRSLIAQFNIAGVPPLVTATMVSYNSIKVSWNTVPGASGYQVYRATSAGGKYSLVKTTSSLSYTNKSLKTGTTYYYKVRSYTKSGRTKVYSDYSAVTSATPVLGNVPGASAAAYNPTTVKISWGKVAGRSGYEVWRSTSPEGGFALVKSTSSTSYKNTKLTPSVTGKPVTYYYMVRAYRKVGGRRVYSAFTAVTGASPTFADVSGVSAARSSATKIKVSWAKVSGASGYEVWRSTLPDSGFTLVKSTSSRSYTNTKLTTGVTYYYKVRAYVKVGRVKVYSADSAVASATP